jgi:hypothetical protein
MYGYLNLSPEDIKGEIWKDIIGFENTYQISSFGRIKSLDRIININGGNGGKYVIKGKILKQNTNTGYCCIGLDRNNKKYMFKVHILVAKAFISNPYDKKTINHKGNKLDNRISEIEWSTQSENNNHAYETKRKIPPRQKKVIQMDMNSNVIKIWNSCRLAGRELNIHAQSISAVALGKLQSTGGFKWKYVKSKKKTETSLENQLNEIWLPIVGYELLYEISNLGRVKSLLNNIILSQTQSSEYRRVVLTNNKIRKNKLVHRLVAETFIPNTNNKLFVNHKNGNKHDNRVSELEWCTSSENNSHAVKFKKILRGSNNSASKLTEDDVLVIRKLVKTMSSRKVAKIYNMNKSTILDIKNNKIWTHV